MSDLKALRPIALACILAILGPFGVKAVMIEGFDPQGNIVTVAVSEDQRLLISVATGVAQAVFFLSSQPVTAFQGSFPWLVQQSSPITLSIDSAIVTSVSTAAVFSNTNFTINAVATQVLATDPVRQSSLVCNDSTLQAWMGPTAGVTAGVGGNGKLLPSGACFSPDNPIRFTGSLWINTTASLKIGVVEITQ